MKIDSNASLVFKNQFTGSNTSTQGIKKAIDTAGENSPFELQLQQSGSLDSPSSQSFKMPLPLSRVHGPGRGDGVVHIEDVVKFADAAMKDAKNQLDSAFA